MQPKYFFRSEGQVELLDIRFPGAQGFFSTRKGGVSRREYCSLNVAAHVGDDPVRVNRNREVLAGAVFSSINCFVSGEQVHGDHVEVVNSVHAGCGFVRGKPPVPGADALVTGVPGLFLASFYADCVPVYIFDTRKKVIGLAHAGWKGTVKGIASKTVRVMNEEFGTVSSDCAAFIGPSIGPCCYVVEGSVKNAFNDEVFPSGVVKHAGQDNKWHLDLWHANKADLLSAGLSEKNIILSRICTSCAEERFFSYRRDGGQTGRMAAFLQLE